MKEVGFEPGWKSEGVMDGKSGESTEREHVVGTGQAKSEIDKLG